VNKDSSLLTPSTSSAIVLHWR